MSTFYRENAMAFVCWGCSFDSLLELKYAISMQLIGYVGQNLKEKIFPSGDRKVSLRVANRSFA